MELVLERRMEDLSRAIQKETGTMRGKKKEPLSSRLPMWTANMAKPLEAFNNIKRTWRRKCRTLDKLERAQLLIREPDLELESQSQREGEREMRE